ncbi:MAG: hypothetical protein IJQ34_00015 [Kiritimatiellae bacterium]|nr:hypothetical protein [Kiritimatiellia bacterium]
MGLPAQILFDEPKSTPRPHRWTGRPKGRPKRLPDNFDEIIFDALKKRMDKSNNTVIPYWRGLIEEFHIGRNTLAKAIRSLKEKGYLKIVLDQSIAGTSNNGTVYAINPQPIVELPRIHRPAIAGLRIENWANAGSFDLMFDRFTILEGGFAAKNSCVMNAFKVLSYAANGSSPASIPYAWINEARPTVISLSLSSEDCASLTYTLSLIRKGRQVRVVDEGVYANCRQILERGNLGEDAFAISEAQSATDSALVQEVRRKLRNMWLLAPDPFLMDGAFRLENNAPVDLPFANLASYIALQCGSKPILRRTMMNAIRAVYTPIKDFSLEKEEDGASYLAVHYCGELDSSGTPFKYIGNDEKILFLASFVCAMNEHSAPLHVVWNSPLNWLAPQDAAKILERLKRSFARRGQLIIL